MTPSYRDSRQAGGEPRMAKGGEGGRRGARRVRSVPPRPSGAPRLPPGVPSQRGAGDRGGGESPFFEWLRASRPDAPPGIWRYGHEPKPPEEPDRIPDRQLIGGAVLSFLSGLLVWSLCWNGYITIWLWPLDWFRPDSWRAGMISVVTSYVYYGLFIMLLAYVFGRLGQWPEVLRRYVLPLPLLRPPEEAPEAEAGPEEAEDPAGWPELRAAGHSAEAEALAGAARSGAMNDVDHTRITREWEAAGTRPARLKAFSDGVLHDGAAACAHPSGQRDLGARAYRHDLMTGQVRIGTAPEDERNPYAYRGSGIALEADLVGTGLLAVGPAADELTRRVTGPVAESLCLQALARRAAVVVVGSPGAELGPDDAYDVVIRVGDAGSPHDLDLYGGTSDPDEAAALLAEALLGGEEGGWGHGRQAATALAQLLGVHQATYGRFPNVPELRGLLDGDPDALAHLRQDCGTAAQEAAAGDRGAAAAALRELDARERQLSRPGDIGPLLADRLAVLDRPVFTRFFNILNRGGQFSMRALQHPMRVRIDLPERAHAEASRVLARLLLAQFTAMAPARADRSLFAALVLDDAAHTATPESVRAIQRLRTAHAGVVLGLRGLDEVAEQLRGPLLAAVGCRMALTGVSTWDGRHFAEAWGAEWVEARDVTHVPDLSGGLVRRLLRGIRQLFTGTKATSRSVTVRTVERERWSASELANTLPPGHAVVSVTTVRGERTPPVLVDLHH